MSAGSTRERLAVRNLRRADLSDIVRIDAALTGEEKPAYGRRIFTDFVGKGPRTGRVGLAAEAGDRLVGYILGEVRAFEFGSEPCGWIFAVGVDRKRLRRGVASDLLEEACRRFRRIGITSVRTMVRRNDVPVLSFFRSNRFIGGSFVELQRELDG